MTSITQLTQSLKLARAVKSQTVDVSDSQDHRATSSSDGRGQPHDDHHSESSDNDDASLQVSTPKPKRSNAQIWTDLLTPKSIVEATSFFCPCSDRGGTPCMSRFAVEDVFKVRFELSKIQPNVQYKQRFEHLVAAQARLRGDSTKKPMVEVGGHLICFAAYSCLIGAKDGAVRRVWRLVRGGAKVIEQGRPRICDEEKGDPLKSDLSLDCYAWIQQWGREYGEQDASPKDYDIVLDPFDIGEVYTEYARQFQWAGCSSFGGGVHPISSTQFRRLFARWMDQERVRVRQKKNITTKCDACEDLKRRRQTSASKEKYEELKRESAKHRTFIRTLRTYYRQDCIRARNDPYFAVVAFDGSDQQSTHVPLHWTKSQRGEYDENGIVRQKVQLNFKHGVPDQLDFYCFTPKTVQGMNLAMSCLCESLKSLSPAVEEVRLQCDGGPENLNYSLFCLCATLVAAGIFKTILINRLPVGHTHNDVDAAFSHFTKRFFGWGKVPGLPGGISTMDEFDDEFKKSYEGSSMRYQRKIACLDFKALFCDCLGFENYGTTKKQSKAALAQGGRDAEYHSIKIYADERGIPHALGRYSELQNTWLPRNSPGVPVFNEKGMSMLAMLLAGTQKPSLAALDGWECRNLVESTLQRSRHFTDLQKKAWRDWFAELPDSLEDSRLKPEQTFRWDLDQWVSRVKEFRARRAPLCSAPGSSTDHAAQEDLMTEQWVWAGHTRAQLEREQRQRARNYSNATDAKQRQAAAQLLRDQSSAADDPSDYDHAAPRKDCVGVDVAIYGDYQDTVRIGDVLLIQPDEVGVANDVANGYNLGINVVEVTRIVTKSSVEVSYMFAKNLEGPWQRWIQKGSGE
eukprot:c15337_g1_i1.p1 GENE.c15337_g1_i1~~c15337_g1_i1.p1  ORF type:complete len:855 (+),score=130.87 c15337_g1_i1:156-2720(+)